MPIAEINQLSAALKGLSGKITPIGTRVVAQSLQAIERKVKVIPGATFRNKPGRKDAEGNPLSFYERNRGTWYPVKQKKTMPTHITKANKAMRATKAQKAELGIVGYKLSPTSEQSSKRWKITTGLGEGGGVVGELINDASYSGSVFGWKAAEPTQAALMQSIGWVSVEDAITAAQPAIDKAITAGVNEVLKALIGE